MTTKMEKVLKMLMWWFFAAVAAWFVLPVAVGASGELVKPLLLVAALLLAWSWSEQADTGDQYTGYPYRRRYPERRRPRRSRSGSYRL